MAVQPVSRPIRRTLLALGDIAEIAMSLGKAAGLGTGERFLQVVERSAGDLAEMPAMGWDWASSEANLQGVRAWSVPGFCDYLIFYRETADGLEVLRVLHCSRELFTKP